MKLNKPKKFENVEERYESHTLNEILPYLPGEDCFFDTRHWVVGLLDDILPFSVTTKISSNHQQFLKLSIPMKEINQKCEPVAFGYTRDSNGKVTHRHIMEYVNTIHATTGHGGSTDCFIGEPVLHIPEATAKGYAEVHIGGVYDSSYPESKTRRGRVQDGGMVTPTITRGCEQLRYFEGCSPSYRIRKLTPRECFRLMGVDDEYVDRIQQAGISNSQQYKMAGNSIVVDVLFHIFKRLFVEKESNERQLSLF